MKRAFIVVICLSAMMLMFSCSAPLDLPPVTTPSCDPPASVETEPITDQTEPVSDQTVSDLELYDFTTVLYQTGEAAGVFSVSEEKSYQSRKFTDNTAPKTRTMDIFGTAYELQYANSGAYALTGQEIHVYTIPQTKSGKVFIDAQTDQVVKYVSIPYTLTEKTEEDFLQTVRRLVGDTVDLSAYEYSCATWYKAVDDKGLESKEIPGFRVCGKNEYLQSYTFSYSKQILGFDTVEGVVAVFSDDRFYLEIVDFGYTEEQFADLLTSWDSYELAVKNYLSSATKQEYSIQETEIKHHTFFIRDGALHVATKASVTFEKNGEPAFSTFVQAITVCEPKNS